MNAHSLFQFHEAWPDCRHLAMRDLLAAGRCDLNPFAIFDLID